MSHGKQICMVNRFSPQYLVCQQHLLWSMVSFAIYSSAMKRTTELQACVITNEMVNLLKLIKGTWFGFYWYFSWCFKISVSKEKLIVLMLPTLNLQLKRVIWKIIVKKMTTYDLPLTQRLQYTKFRYKANGLVLKLTSLWSKTGGKSQHISPQCLFDKKAFLWL